MTRKYYWDACAWIALINEEPGRYDNTQWVIEQAQQGKVQIWTSTLSRVEVLKANCSDENKSIEIDREKAFEEFLDQDFVFEVVLDHRIANLARRLIRQYDKLKKPNDGVHLATAVQHNVDELHTYDHEDLIPLDGAVYRDDGVLLKICEIPPIPSGGVHSGPDLFDGHADADETAAKS